MKNLEFKGFDGHLILLCKSHYKLTESFIESLKMIWAIRCGYPYDKNDNSSIRYILDGLYKILEPTIENPQQFQEKLHESLISCIYDLNTLEKLVLFYRDEISMLQVREKSANGKWTTLIKLPQPQKRLFNRILTGNGRYDDYKLIQK